jgi:hypothetical protein
MREGDAMAFHNKRTEDDLDLAEELKADVREAEAEYDRLLEVVQDAQAEKDRTLQALRAAFRASGQTQKAFLAAEPGKTLNREAAAADREFKKQDAALKKAKDDLDNAEKALADSRLQEHTAGFEGHFGRTARN